MPPAKLVEEVAVLAAEGCVCQKVKGFGDLRPLSTIEAMP